MSDKKTSDPVDVPAFAREVAAALGDGWTTAPGFREAGDDAYLFHPGDPKGDRFYLRLTGTTRVADRGKVTIGASLPNGLLRYESDSSPHVENRDFKAAFRGPKWVADKIRTEWLPQQREAVSSARAGLAEAQRDAETRDAITATLLDVLGPLGRQVGIKQFGMADRVPAIDERLDISVSNPDGDHVADLEIRPGGRLKVELSLPGSQAEQLAATLVALLTPQGGAG